MQPLWASGNQCIKFVKWVWLKVELRQTSEQVYTFLKQEQPENDRISGPTFHSTAYRGILCLWRTE